MGMTNATSLFSAVIIAVCLPMGVVSARNGPAKFLSCPEPWFARPGAKQVAANILSFQSKLGGWTKNINNAAAPAKPG